MVQNLRLSFITRLHDGASPSPRERVCKGVNFLLGSGGGKGKLAPVFVPAPGTDWLGPPNQADDKKQGHVLYAVCRGVSASWRLPCGEVF